MKNEILSFVNLTQRHLRKLNQKVNQMINHLFFTPVGTMIFFLFFYLFQRYLQKLHHLKVNQKICQLFSTSLRKMKFSKVASESIPNDFSPFFISDGNNDILSFFNRIHRYLWMSHHNVSHMICQLFSTPVGTTIFYLFLTSFKDTSESCIPKVNQVICQLSSNFLGNNDILYFSNITQRY